MLDRREYASSEGSRSETASNGADNSRALQAYENHETGVALPLPDDSTNYAELFARLQKLIDNATQTIRDLRRENADLHGRVSQLDAYINMRAEAVNNEEELQKSASRLEELLTMQAMAAAKELHPPPPAPPTPLRAFEPAPAPAPLAPPAAPPPMPVMAPIEPVSVATNGHASLRDTAPFAAPPASLPPAEPMMPTFTPPVPPTPFIEPRRQEAAAHFAPAVSERAVVTLPVVPLMPEPEPVAVPEAPELVVETPMQPMPPVSRVTIAPVAAAPVAPVVEPARVSAPPPLPVRRPAPASISGNEKMAGTYTLVVYPFTRFSDLGQFQSVLQEVVGIHDVQVRRFAQGTLEMRLGYDGTIPLPQALHNLSIGIEDVEEEEPYRLRVRLDLNHGS